MASKFIIPADLLSELSIAHADNTEPNTKESMEDEQIWMTACESYKQGFLKCIELLQDIEVKTEVKTITIDGKEYYQL